MSVERYVMRPVARDAAEFDGTYESALEIAEWMGGFYHHDKVTLTAIDEKNAFLGIQIQNITLSVQQTGMFGIPMDTPLLMWGHTDEGDKGKPITMFTEGGGLAAYPGYFIVKNPDNSFVAVPPEKFNELYRKQN